MGFGRCEIPALRSSMLLSVRFGTNSAMTPFLEHKEAPYITTALALEWAMLPVDHQPSDWARRLGFVRVFARHWSATDQRTEIPAAGLLPFRARRARPYLYTEEEIERLLAAAKSLSPAGGLRAWTYHSLFGLLAVSGPVDAQ